jgi:hypothetical protein
VTVTYIIFPLNDAVLFTAVTQQWSLYSPHRALLKQRNSQHNTEIQQEYTLLSSPDFSTVAVVMNKARRLKQPKHSDSRRLTSVSGRALCQIATILKQSYCLQETCLRSYARIGVNRSLYFRHLRPNLKSDQWDAP